MKGKKRTNINIVMMEMSPYNEPGTIFPWQELWNSPPNLKHTTKKTVAYNFHILTNSAIWMDSYGSLFF